MPVINGVHVPPWEGRRAQDALDLVRRKHQPRPGHPLGTPCCLCHQRIDYRRKGRPDSLSVQHIRSRRDFPHLTWEPSNWAPAHKTCNLAAGAGSRSTDIGITS